MEPTKHDGDKVRYDLLPAEPLHEVAEVFTHGAAKYDDYNYLGLEKARLFGALLRHAFAWWRGEEVDEETGKSHLAHAVCCALMLRHQETDDEDCADTPYSRIRPSQVGGHSPDARPPSGKHRVRSLLRSEA